MIYDDPARRDDLFRDFVQDGIRRGERTLLLKAGPTDGGLIASGAGPGQFDAVSSTETYIGDGHFDSDSVLDTLRSELDRSLAAGFPAFRAAGEPPIELRANGCSHELVRYERSANELFATKRMTAICAYHVPTTSPDAVIGIIDAHPVVFFAQKPNYRVGIEEIEPRRFAISGWLDLTTMGSVVDTLKKAVDDRGDLVLDLAKIDFVDLAAIRLFAEAADRLSSQGSTLFLRSAPPWMLDILELLDCSPSGLVVQ